MTFKNDGTDMLLVIHEDGSKDVCMCNPKNLPPTKQWAEWKPSDNQSHEHYTIENGKLIYVKPLDVVLPEVEAAKELEQKLTVLAEDADVDDATYGKLMRISKIPDLKKRQAEFDKLKGELP